MKNKTTKTTDTSTQLPLSVIDMDAYKALDTSGLQAVEREIIALYLMVNKIGGSAQSRVTQLVEQGKPGHTKIINIAKWLQVQGQSTATLKVQVNRAMTKAQTGLSLQGLGKGQTPVIAPKQDKKGGAGGEGEQGEGAGNTLTIQYDNDSFDQDAFDQMFGEWDKATQQYFIDHMTAQLKK